MIHHPVWNRLSPRDNWTAWSYISDMRDPDFTIAPDGNPYLYRWYVVPKNEVANVFFHVQVASDPERPLHDHPWDNVSNILSGGYLELLNHNPKLTRQPLSMNRKAGEIITRDADEAHRLILPDGVPYTMTLFMTGPKVREWGYWYPDGWRHNERHTLTRNGVSVHV